MFQFNKKLLPRSLPPFTSAQAIASLPHALDTVVLAPRILKAHLRNPLLLIVDLTTPHIYAQGHISGAVFLDYHRQLEVTHPPLSGRFPSVNGFSRLLSELGVTSETHIVAYDEEGGDKAGRLCWALDSMGHHRWSLLDGGRIAWLKELYPLDHVPVKRIPSNYWASFQPQFMVTQEYILSRLGADDMVLLDARTPGEFSGEDFITVKAGHIPGAVNLDWMLTLDTARGWRIRSRNYLKKLFENAGVTPTKEIITYCHGHQRAAHTYVVLKLLGYPNIKGYVGAWNEWGNLADTPVEQSFSFAEGTRPEMITITNADSKSV